MRTSPADFLLAALAALAVALVPSAAAGHGVAAEVDQREGAVAVRVRYHGDRPLADARYEVRSPRGGEAPFAEGRTDRHGWLAFVPDVAGTWKVRVADAGGHGKVVDVEVAEVAVPQGGGRGGTEAQGGGAAVEVDPTPGVLRVVGGLAVIAVVFGALFAVQRARRARGG